MRYLLLFVLIICDTSGIFAQRAYDGECLVGLEGVKFTFWGSNLPILSSPKSKRIAFSHGASSIADKDGKLVIACSTHDIYNSNADTMEGGYRITPPKIAQQDSYYSGWTQNSIILPKGNDQYYVFTTTMSDNAYDDWDNGIRFRFDMLTYHVVDMKENNGLGKVIKKSQILIKDSVLSSNRMTAVKHGNGRDWWLVLPHQTEHKFYLFLISNSGIAGPFIKSVDYPVIDSFFGGQYGQSCFNRSGDKYAYCTSSTQGVFILNFNRCNGNFSKYNFYKLPQDTSLALDWPSGTCFSPNDSLLYANTSYNIFQFDINDTSANSLQFIHGPDIDSANEFNQQYANIYIGADDRLYIGNFHGVKSTMSYIEQPNKRGTAAGFCRRCLQVPNNNAKGLPNMPWYHLGKKEGSICDTISEAPTWEAIRIYPNPVSGILNVYFPLEENTAIDVSIYNIMGQKLFSSSEKLNALQQFTIDMSALAKGIYILRMESERTIWQEKVVKE